MYWNMMNGWLGMMGYTSLSMLVFLAIFFILFVWALVDVLQAKRESEWKILWLLVIVLVPIVGFFIYLIIGRQERVKRRRR
ncbi:MAG: PLDc N-terminal domain-containing protein [Candidatus Aenigmarchaeota archaeon]|nr:PLDc N-terminal domain-containing protein [Candidatus Aenigmarchaeota archaeon]MDI6722227.1 PLDc N-terminal domain-containing protein [Candidatus Aenigmarchaeota archaeon]